MSSLGWMILLCWSAVVLGVTAMLGTGIQTSSTFIVAKAVLVAVVFLLIVIAGYQLGTAQL